MASNYNGQPRPAVVLVAEGKGELIRRRDSYEDMMAGEIVPALLAHSTPIRQIR
jgi:diaminopimelate decarboxylase